MRLMSAGAARPPQLERPWGSREGHSSARSDVKRAPGPTGERHIMCGAARLGWGDDSDAPLDLRQPVLIREDLRGVQDVVAPEFAAAHRSGGTLVVEPDRQLPAVRQPNRLAAALCFAAASAAVATTAAPVATAAPRAGGANRHKIEPACNVHQRGRHLPRRRRRGRGGGGGGEEGGRGGGVVVVGGGGDRGARRGGQHVGERRVGQRLQQQRHVDLLLGDVRDRPRRVAHLVVR